MSLPEDNFEEEEDDQPFRTFGEDLSAGIASPVKQFLINYLGDALNNAEPETFRAIEEVLKGGSMYEADMIPDVLYHHCTIKDYKEWDKAIDNFVPDDNAVYPWPDLEGWYDRPDDDEDDDDDDDASDEEREEPEMPEEAKRIIEHVDHSLNEHQKFKTFMHECTAVIIAEIRTWLEKNSSFDLAHLTAEGFMELQKSIHNVADIMAENLHAVVADLLPGSPPQKQ